MTSKAWRVVRQFGPSFTPSTEKAYRVESVEAMTQAQAVRLAGSMEDAARLRAEVERLSAELALAEAEAEDARDGGLDISLELVEANSDRDRLAAEVERLRGLLAAADQFGDRHVIDLREDGWTIAHPLSCRAAGLFACPVNTAAGPLRKPGRLGRFAVTVEDEQIVVGERVDHA